MIRGQEAERSARWNCGWPSCPRCFPRVWAVGIPVLVVTGARGADENWRRLQQDEASLSERGCVITAQQSGHVVPLDQPKVVVDAIRTVVEIARGQEGPRCGSVPAESRGRE